MNNYKHMRINIIVVAIIIFMGSQKTFSQNSSIKGRIIDYETNYAIAAVTLVPDSIQFGGLSDMNGNFEIKGNTRQLEVSFVGYYPIKFINTPIEDKQIDLRNIKMIPNHLMDHMVVGGPPSDLYDFDKQKEQDKILRKNVLKEYRIKVIGKKLKPYFEGNYLIFDFENGGK